MRLTLLAACLVAVTAPALGQHSLKPEDADDFRAMAELLERMKIIRCENSSNTGDFYEFWRAPDGSVAPVIKYPEEEEKVLVSDGMVTFITDDAVIVLTDDERVEVVAGRVDRSPCREVAKELAWAFRSLSGPAD